MALIPKRIFALDEYIQLLVGDLGYEDPANIFLVLDKSDWPESKKLALIQIIESLPNAQDVADLITAFLVGDGSITLAKLANMETNSLFYRKSVGVGPPEVNTLATLRADLNIPEASTVKQSVYTITLDTVGSVASRVAGAVETTDYPTGWVLAATGDTGKNLQIIHTEIGRTVSSITVKYTDMLGMRTLVPFRSAYSGILENAETLIIEGLALKVDLPLTIIINFN